MSESWEEIHTRLHREAGEAAKPDMQRLLERGAQMSEMEAIDACFKVAMDAILVAVAKEFSRRG